MKMISCRFLNPNPGIFRGWLEWCEVTYTLNTVGSGRLYTVHDFKIKERECGTHGRIPIPPKPPATLEDFIALNAHLIDIEISKRVMKRDHQRPDDLPAKMKSPIKKRASEGHGTPTFSIPDL